MQPFAMIYEESMEVNLFEAGRRQRPQGKDSKPRIFTDYHGFPDHESFDYHSEQVTPITRTILIDFGHWTHDIGLPLTTGRTGKHGDGEGPPRKRNGWNHR